MDCNITPPVLRDVELVALILKNPGFLDEGLWSLVLTIVGVVVPVEYSCGQLV